MTKLSPNAQLVSDIFDQVAKGNGAPFWEACHDDVVWLAGSHGCQTDAQLSLDSLVNRQDQ